MQSNIKNIVMITTKYLEMNQIVILYNLLSVNMPLKKTICFFFLNQRPQDFIISSGTLYNTQIVIIIFM